MRCCDLFEGVQDHLLYHLMTADKATHVASTDAMEARWEHLIGGRRVHGNSMSRNRHFTFGGGSYQIRLVCDRRALAQRHRIIPLDAEIVHRNTYRPGGYVEPDRSIKAADVQFAEEFVVGPISNLHRYVRAVEIIPNRYVNSVSYWAYAEVKRWCDRFQLKFVMDDVTRKSCQKLEDDWWEEDEDNDQPVRMFEQADALPSWFTAGQIINILDDKWDAGEFLEGDEFDYEWRLCRVPADFVQPAMVDPEESRSRMADIRTWMGQRDLAALLTEQPPVMIVNGTEQLICDGNHRSQVAKEEGLPFVPMLVAFGSIA